jgi:hypothetical protein
MLQPWLDAKGLSDNTQVGKHDSALGKADAFMGEIGSTSYMMQEPCL